MSDLELVQKSEVEIILGEKYKNYKQGLDELGIESLEERRDILCKRFATKCLKNEKAAKMFPLKNTSNGY